MTKIIEDSRFEISLLIKNLEGSRLGISPEALDQYISHLHKISLTLISSTMEKGATVLAERSTNTDRGISNSKNPTEKLQTVNTKPLHRCRSTSKNSLESASQRLDHYLEISQKSSVNNHS